MILYKVERADIESNIDIYFRYHFQKLKEDRSQLVPEEQLAPDWPGPDAYWALVRRAVPLFIFAATICRLIANPTDNPNSQLSRIMEQQIDLTRLELTYMPVFQQLVAQSASRDERAVAHYYIGILGPIVTFTDPLSVSGISKLLQVKATSIS